MRNSKMYADCVKNVEMLKNNKENRESVLNFIVVLSNEELRIMADILDVKCEDKDLVRAVFYGIVGKR